MEHWGIDLSKEYLKFSAAHFLIFPDGSTERLHGHNYRVFVELEAGLDEFGLVIDFQRIKPVVRELCDYLDEHWLLPEHHPVLSIHARPDGVTEVRYKDLFYAAPSTDVIALPINNTSSENLATWIGRELRERLRERFPQAPIQNLRVAVEETSGQRGIYRYQVDPA
ncbi:MAG: 6-carboxytetrahydropterin synthase [Planctomycetes bacterium]|nr:6-carboxytetrahydropterin synthase [Planctomycetota bacterium]MCB9909433.1 6-carboxytetrahydropterin synthase [Planctomycetota bacterium]HPF15297.1 6-carboxytetrahydropterin synthase [Planctomycetota bacterium]HRV82900.1 6-carboxytetrahydropterin synthase [Planctomycetota bacterium]